MDSIKKFADRHVFVFSILSILIIVDVPLAIYQLFNIKSYPSVSFILHIVNILLVFLIMISIGMLRTVGYRRKGLLKGILFGWFSFFYAAAIISIFVSNRAYAISPAISVLLLDTFYMFEVGLVEESTFRGIILNTMLKKWGSSKRGILICVLLSSVLFGLYHFSTLITSPNLVISTIAQVVFTFCNGVFFAAIYLRSKNLWSVIIIHAVYDWSLKMLDLFFPSTFGFDAAFVDKSLIMGFKSILTGLPFLLIGLFLLRKVKPTEIEEQKPEPTPVKA